MTLCLLVEDSNTQRKIIKRLAQSCGLDIIEADNGLEALKVCEDNIPDIIILDMNMPEMSGIEFLDSLQKIPKDFTSYIIICSADVNTDAIVAAVKAGADEYHCKSIDIDNLRKKILGAPCMS